MLNISREELSLKRKLIEKLDKPDDDFKESMEKINKTMENISSSIQHRDSFDAGETTNTTKSISILSTEMVRS